MKKSIQTWAVAIVAILLALPAFGEKDIMWDSKWKSANPIIVCNMDETSDMLTLDFLKDLGNVIVSITDASGNVVYQESVQTDVTPSVIIPLEGLDVDGGTVSVTDGENLVYGFINL